MATAPAQWWVAAVTGAVTFLHGARALWTERRNGVNRAVTLSPLLLPNAQSIQACLRQAVSLLLLPPFASQDPYLISSVSIQDMQSSSHSYGGISDGGGTDIKEQPISVGKSTIHDLSSINGSVSASAALLQRGQNRTWLENLDAR